MKEETHELVKQIKQSFRFRMNGVASHSMREKGISYKINWGIPLPELRQMAQPYGKNYDLAIELWKEDIRECQVMATFIMPAERLDADLIDVWMERVRTQEMAEILTFNLLQKVPFAQQLAFRWIASDKIFQQICGYNLLAGSFSRGEIPDDRAINEFLDQAGAALQASDLPIKHAAYNSVLRFCGLGDSYEKIARKALQGLDLL